MSRRCRALLAAGLMLCLVGLAAARAPDVPAANEISYLLQHLGGSACRFERNGTWHEAPQAVEHLRRKYDYLLRRGLVPSTEAFIERAATQSSVTGQPYRVQCADQPPEPSARWLQQALDRYRASQR